VPIQPPVQ